jgi:hypothetical protein
MSDWVRCDTREQAEAWLNEQLENTLDQAHYDMIHAGLTEDQISDGIQAVYRICDQARERGLAEIDKAFQRNATPTLH